MLYLHTIQVRWNHNSCYPLLLSEIYVEVDPRWFFHCNFTDRIVLTERSAFFPPQAKHRGCGTALTLRDTQRILVFYAVHRESDWRAAINRNVLAGKCKLSAKPRFETMLLVMDEVGGGGVSAEERAHDVGYFVN